MTQARSVHAASATKAQEIAVEARENYHHYGVLFLDEVSASHPLSSSFIVFAETPKSDPVTWLEEIVSRQENPEFNEKLQHRGIVRLASLPAKLIDGRPRARALSWNWYHFWNPSQAEHWRGVQELCDCQMKLGDFSFFRDAGDVFQGAEAHNCGFMAALAAIADNEDGYLVRLLLQQNEHEHDNDL